MRLYIRMRMAPTTELLKRALRVDVEPAKDGVTLICEGRRWTLKPLAKGGAYLRCGDGLPIPLHVICRDLDDAKQVVESTTKRLGEGRAPTRGVFRLDDVSAPSHVGA